MIARVTANAAPAWPITAAMMKAYRPASSHRKRKLPTTGVLKPCAETGDCALLPVREPHKKPEKQNLHFYAAEKPHKKDKL